MPCAEYPGSSYTNKAQDLQPWAALARLKVFGAMPEVLYEGCEAGGLKPGTGT